MTKEEFLKQKWGAGMVGLDDLTKLEYPITGVDFDNELIELDGRDSAYDHSDEDKCWVGFEQVTIVSDGVPMEGERHPKVGSYVKHLKLAEYGNVVDQDCNSFYVKWDSGGKTWEAADSISVIGGER